MSESDNEAVFEINLGCVPAADVSGPLLLQTDDQTILTFNARSLDTRQDLGRAVINIEGCLKTCFGHPNDEALAGHPLSRKGLGAYGIYEVTNSSWIAEVNAQNKVCFPDFEYGEYRHFVFTFHDSTLECIATELIARTTKQPEREILSEIFECMLGERAWVTRNWEVTRFP